MASSAGNNDDGFDVASLIATYYTDDPSSYPAQDKNFFWRESATKHLDSGDSVLYVSQGEFAVLDPPSLGHIRYVASDQATTCHITVLLHPGLKVIGLAHFDGSSLEQGVSDMLQLMEDRCRVTAHRNHLSENGNHLLNKFDLYVFGGFLDPKGHSRKLSQDLLECFCSSSYVINLKTICIGCSNTQLVNDRCHPVVTGIGVDGETLEILKVKCLSPGPDIQIRGCRNFVAREKMKCMYDNETKEFIIEPFDFEPFPNIDLWLKQSDNFILKHLSTGPEQEDEDFVTNIRSTLQCIRDHSEQPLETLFNGGEARRYTPTHSGGWILVV